MKARFTSVARALALLGALLMLPGSVVAQISPFLQGLHKDSRNNGHRLSGSCNCAVFGLRQL